MKPGATLFTDVQEHADTDQGAAVENGNHSDSYHEDDADRQSHRSLVSTASTKQDELHAHREHRRKLHTVRYHPSVRSIALREDEQVSIH